MPACCLLDSNPSDPWPETRRRTNYMALEEFIFPDGQPEAIVDWQIKSPKGKKNYRDHVFNKNHNVCFLNQLLGNVEDPWRGTFTRYRVSSLMFGQLVRKQRCGNHFPVFYVTEACIGLILQRQPLPCYLKVKLLLSLVQWADIFNVSS